MKVRHAAGAGVVAVALGGCFGPLANPGDTKNCGDFSSQATAQAWFLTYYPSYGDVARLDADKDMIACEAD